MAEEKSVRLPTVEELRALPRWARAAFAIRCARRLQPLLDDRYFVGVEGSAKRVAEQILSDLESGTARHDWKPSSFSPDWGSTTAAQSPEGQIQRSIIHSINCAKDATLAAYVEPSRLAVIERYRAAEAAHILDPTVPFIHDPDVPTNEEREIRYGAQQAVEAAKPSLSVASLLDRSRAEPDNNSPSLIEPLFSAIERDYELLKAASAAERWTNETPVPPEFFGPLWPWGEPEGWPDVTDYNRPEHHAADRMSLRVMVPDFMSDDEAAEHIAGLYRVLNEYHIACGGQGLSLDLDDWHILVNAVAPVGVA